MSPPSGRKGKGRGKAQSNEFSIPFRPVRGEINKNINTPTHTNQALPLPIRTQPPKNNNNNNSPNNPFMGNINSDDSGYMADRDSDTSSEDDETTSIRSTDSDNSTSSMETDTSDHEPPPPGVHVQFQLGRKPKYLKPYLEDMATRYRHLWYPDETNISDIGLEFITDDAELSTDVDSLINAIRRCIETPRRVTVTEGFSPSRPVNPNQYFIVIEVPRGQEAAQFGFSSRYNPNRSCLEDLLEVAARKACSWAELVRHREMAFGDFVDGGRYSFDNFY